MIHQAPLPFLETATGPRTDAVAVIPRFCHECGSAWQPDWATCAKCRDRPSSPLLTAQTLGPDRSIQQALTLYFCLLGLCGVHILTRSSGADQFNLGLTVEILMSAWVLIWAGARWRSDLAGLLRVPPIGWFILALAMSVATVSIGACVINGVQSAFHLPATKIATPFLHHQWGGGMLILAVVVQPAIIEELAFRGIILGAMQRILGASQAIIVSALMFMILHLSPARFPHTLALGLAAGVLRVRSRSLLPCFLLHFSHNFLCLALEWTAR
jgi:membrane protease YdiL (CAAX protease family)